MDTSSIDNDLDVSLFPDMELDDDWLHALSPVRRNGSTSTSALTGASADPSSATKPSRHRLGYFYDSMVPVCVSKWQFAPYRHDCLFNIACVCLQTRLQRFLLVPYTVQEMHLSSQAQNHQRPRATAIRHVSGSWHATCRGEHRQGSQEALPRYADVPKGDFWRVHAKHGDADIPATVQCCVCRLVQVVNRYHVARVSAVQAVIQDMRDACQGLPIVPPQLQLHADSASDASTVVPMVTGFSDAETEYTSVPGSDVTVEELVEQV